MQHASPLPSHTLQPSLETAYTFVRVPPVLVLFLFARLYRVSSSGTTIRFDSRIPPSLGTPRRILIGDIIKYSIGFLQSYPFLFFLLRNVYLRIIIVDERKVDDGVTYIRDLRDWLGATC